MKRIKLTLSIAAIVCSITVLSAADRGGIIEPSDPHPGDQSAWASLTKTAIGWGSIDVKYSRSQVAQVQKSISLEAWRGERVSAQAVISTPSDISSVRMTASDLRCGKSVIPSSSISTWFVRYTIAGRPGESDSVLVPDGLDPAGELSVPARTTRPLWIEVKVPAETKPGVYKGTLSVTCDREVTALPYQLKVYDHVLPEPDQWRFHLDLWQNPYAVARYFGVPLWSEEHFDLMRPTMKRYADAGAKVITASIIQHPWNSQTFDPFEDMIAKFRHIDGTWSYDYTVFDQWIEFMMDCGIKEQIDCYTLVPWHYKIDYYDCATNSVKQVDCRPQEKAYRDLVLPFLKDFASHLKEKGWFDITCIAMDERPMEQMNAAYSLVMEADPEYRIAGAANYNVDSEEADKIYDMSVTYQFDLLSPEAIARRKSKGQILTFYTCCSPERPNTFTLSDPAEAVIIGWHAAAVGYDGYLRWALNSWPEEPGMDSRYGRWTSGDTYLLYPDGPSIRFIRLVEGIQDFEKIRIFRETATQSQKAELDAVLLKFAPTDFGPSQKAEELVSEGRKILRKL